MDKKSHDEQMALFRYGIISPILFDTVQKQNQYCRQIAGQKFTVPDHAQPKTFAVSTIKSWLAKYKTRGFKALYPQKRVDTGVFKVISDEVKSKIKAMIDETPNISSSHIYRKLIAQGIISAQNFQPGTLRRFIRINRLREVSSKIPRKKFETAAVNQLWMTDFMHGPYLYDASDHNRKKKTYLCAIIDDHTRFIVGAKFFFAENTCALASVFKAALHQHGLTRRLYCDNGSAFSTSFLHLVCANLGIALIHSQAYDSPSRGKIERFFKTVRSMFLIDLTVPIVSNLSIDQLNVRFTDWLNQHYHKNIHAGIQASPLDRLMQSISYTRIHHKTSEELDSAFLVHVIRKVKKDSTISIGGKLFEVPCQYIGAKIDCRRPIDQPEFLTLFEHDQPKHPLHRVNLIDNAYSPAATIRFHQEGIA